MSSGYLDDACPARGPGLTHTIHGPNGSPCLHCQRPVYARGTVTAAGNAGLQALAGYFSVRDGFAVRRVNPDAPEKKQIPAPEPVVGEDIEGIGSECSCFPCRFPDAYPDARHVALRVHHRIQHRDFDEYLHDRDMARIAAMGVPSGRCTLCGPGMPSHGWHA